MPQNYLQFNFPAINYNSQRPVDLAPPFPAPRGTFFAALAPPALRAADFCAALSALAFFVRSLMSRSAASRLAFRWSGFSVRFFAITSRVAPAMARLAFRAAVRLFLRATCCSWSLRCCLRYNVVQAIFAGRLRWLNNDRHFCLKKRNCCKGGSGTWLARPVPSQATF